ncbi:MAG: carboxypeptidase regulatory-like domain-containing protein [Acidobacteria bacterium]|nr:carboxypeptidase regulatory-like domain-containing protein [Acidobacteriota bacterium]
MQHIRHLGCLAAVLILLSMLSPAAPDNHEDKDEAEVRIDESAMRAEIDGQSIKLTVPVRNNAKRNISGIFEVDLVDPDDKTVSSGSTPVEVKKGKRKISLQLPRPVTVPSSGEDPVLWHRLRYQFLDGDQVFFKGIVALGAVTPDMFELRIARSYDAFPGKPYFVRVHATNPVTYRPVKRVEVTGAIKFDSSGEISIINAKTDTYGDTVLQFPIPPTEKIGGTITVEVKNSIHKQKEEFDFTIRENFETFISTDKILYQPGQSLNARAVIFDSSKKAAAGKTVKFNLNSPGNEILLSAISSTDEYGIASVDWAIPDSTELGGYILEVSIPWHDDGNEARYNLGTAEINISRYDLPNFAVEVQTDRPYYLPDQNASVEISARYLFGKELTQGTVKLVHQEAGRWDRKQKKWVVDESDPQLGGLNASGHCTFNIDLTEFYKKLTYSSYRRYQDLTYSAFVTDPTSGKTEQRRFSIRVSQKPIHIYVHDFNNGDGKTSFYLSTYYPDGTPAECKINIHEDMERSDIDPEDLPVSSMPLLRTVRTNRYGVAKISDLEFLKNETDDEALERTHRLILDVRDKKGTNVLSEKNVWTYSSKYIHLKTDKPLYSENSPIIVSGETSKDLAGFIAIDLSLDGAVLWTGRISLRNHKGFTVVPYRPEFKGELTITAYSLDSEGDQYHVPWEQQAVFYPSPSALDVKIKTDRKTYSPGEEVQTKIEFRTSSGSRTDGALGIAVVDKAVEERIRTNQEFGSQAYGFLNWGWLYETGSVGGITRKDLNELDLSKPLSDDMALAAEMMLYRRGWSNIDFEGYGYGEGTRRHFLNRMRKYLEPVFHALDEETVGWKFATNNEEVDRVLQNAGINPGDFKSDPWGTSYGYRYGFDGRHRTIRIYSAGPDKQLDTADDIYLNTLYWPYFKPYGKMIDRTVQEVYTSSESYIRDFDTLKRELLLRGLDLDSLRDPWGNHYSFDFTVDRDSYQIRVSSSRYPILWSSSINYFGQVKKNIDSALSHYYDSTGIFPDDDESFDRAMAGSDTDFRKLADPWGNSYYLKYSYESEYGDVDQITYNAGFRVQNTVPVTRNLAWIRIYSSGPDGSHGNEDDFFIAGFFRDISVRSGKDLVPQFSESGPLSDSGGAIQGVVTDQSEGLLPGTTIVATRRDNGEKIETLAGDDGFYVLRNISPGIYDVIFSLSGFRTMQIRDIPVTSHAATTVNVCLDVASISETVDVSIETESILLESNPSIGMVLPENVSTENPDITEETFTPRLRDYFPETLYWAPSIITDSKGRARVNFKLADNITTWKMSVIASTKTGEIGVAEKEIEAFQPFFLDHEPPKILTVGDSIDLPVIVRNYLPEEQQMDIEMKPGDWFKLENPGKKKIAVDAGDTTKAFFPFRTTEIIKEGKQRVIAANRETGDAIEKTVSVHPDGLEQSSTVGNLLRGGNTLNMPVPENVIPGSLHGRIKVYPNLLSQITDSIEAGLERPYGCGEQIISATYPSLLLLKFYAASGKSNTAMEKKAHRYLELGYERLLNYKEAGGGFSYWGNGSAGVELTAYAIRFLHDASDLMDIDPSIIHSAVKWLISQQNNEGNWIPNRGYDDNGLTAYVAATLAQSEKSAEGPLKQSIHNSVARALAFLKDPHQVFESPYALAEFARAASEFGDRESAETAVDNLTKLAIKEGTGVFWAVTRNTPFYGWGRTGRIESTAVVLKALSTIHPIGEENRRLMDAGILWLLRNKDRYGVWHSGQATVNVLSALIHAFPASNSTEKSARVTALVNDRSVSLNLDPDNSDAPVTVDISEFIHPGENSIVIKDGEALSGASLQAVADYYIPWDGIPAIEFTRTGQLRALRLSVRFDKTEARIGDEIRCEVQAERIGSRGWGMMLAEIGLPPGADVDRGVLDHAIRNSGRDISKYEVLPDRLVLYLWPRAGGTNLTFSFRPRFAMKARSAPSILYDYYNPEAESSVTPSDFIIHSEKGND